MEKKEKIRLGILYGCILLIALITDIKGGKLKEEYSIYRDKPGGDSVEVDLFLTVEDVFEDYAIHLEVEPRQITKEEADTYLLNAITSIDKDFEKIEKTIPIKNFYESDLVKAEWNFSPAGIINGNGEIDTEEIPEDGMIVTANVNLECGAYEKSYTFSFQVEKPEITEKEKAEKSFDVWFQEQQKKEGEEILRLPEELDGFSMEWREKKEYLCLKIVFLEGVSLFLILFGKKRERELAERKKRQKRELQYPEISNQLLILLETGMTTRQAWHKIACLYKEKRKQLATEKSEVYEAILQMDLRMLEGEKEKSAYHTFLNQMDSVCYRRLVRLLINNLEKGNKDICRQLQQEAAQAYEQRILSAKKLGEEASTKMLLPMMLMMILVMLIIIAPAIMGISI